MAFRAVLFVSITLTLATLAQAQGTRTWVSGVGDDLNPCSRTAPCKTFAGAISKTAKGGEIDALDSGGFGPVTITKSITIDGTGAQASILASAANGITINITDPNDTAKSVRLRGLSINGAGSGLNGIKVVTNTTASKVTIEDCVIDGFTGNGIDVAAGQVFVRNTTIRNNGGAGVKVANVSGAVAGLSNVALVFNGSAPEGDVQKIDNVAIFGRTNRPPR
jgi:hypothetical protein